MYNRFTHRKEQSKMTYELDKETIETKVRKSRVKINDKLAEKYKERVRDFLVKVTSKPVKLGKYQPPIKNIERKSESQKILSNVQLYINGFKSNKERIQKVKLDNSILDLSLTKLCQKQDDFRPRKKEKEIQPQMKFKSNSVFTLPPITKEKALKMHYKAVEQMGNGVKNMRQNESDIFGLINRLQTVSGEESLDHLGFSRVALQQSCLASKKHTK